MANGCSFHCEYYSALEQAENDREGKARVVPTIIRNWEMLPIAANSTHIISWYNPSRPRFSFLISKEKLTVDDIRHVAAILKELESVMDYFGCELLK